MRRKASKRQESNAGAGESWAAEADRARAEIQGRASLLVLLLPVTHDPSPMIELRHLEILNLSLPGQTEWDSWSPTTGLV